MTELGVLLIVLFFIVIAIAIRTALQIKDVRDMQFRSYVDMVGRLDGFECKTESERRELHRKFRDLQSKVLPVELWDKEGRE